VADLNRIIHERARLLILTHLASNGKQETSFNELLNRLELTSGNLSIQLKKLKEADYIRIDKTFRENKPHTTVTLTEAGREALASYIAEMERIIMSMKP